MVAAKPEKAKPLEKKVPLRMLQKLRRVVKSVSPGIRLPDEQTRPRVHWTLGVISILKWDSDTDLAGQPRCKNMGILFLSQSRINRKGFNYLWEPVIKNLHC
jgi:hypothetical protein